MSVPLFGEILIEMGALTGEQVEAILEHQKRTRQRFGQIGIRLGWLTPEQVWEAWARQISYRRRFVEPREVGIDTGAVLRVTLPTARALRVLPLRLWGNHLVVAGGTDLSSSTLAALADRTCCRIHACTAFPESIAYHLDRLEEAIQPAELSACPAPVYG